MRQPDQPEDEPGAGTANRAKRDLVLVAAALVAVYALTAGLDLHTVWHGLVASDEAMHLGNLPYVLAFGVISLAWYARRRRRELAGTAERLAAANRHLRDELAQRRRAEAAIEETRAALAASERRYREMVAQIPGAVYQLRWTAGGEPAFAYLSPRISEITGFSAEELLADARRLFEQVHAADRDGFFASIEASRQTLEPWHWEGRFHRKNGEVYWLRGESTPQREADGATVWNGIAFDVTPSRQAEEALKLSEERLRRLIENSPSAISLKDVEGRFQLVNPRFQQWYGLAPEVVIGKTLREVFDGDFVERHVAMDEEVLDSGKVHETELMLPFVDGRPHPVIVTKFPVRGADGRMAGVGTINTDVTRLNEIEAQLRQAQKMEAVGQLTGGIAHDFNNLLSVILGNAELLGEELGEARREVAAVRKAASRGANLTQRLLAFSRQQALRPQPVDVARLVAEMAGLLSRTLGETVKVVTPQAGGEWTALVDPGQLESALVNLAINARDAMPGGGTLGIDTADLRLDAAAGAALGLPAGDYVRVSVVDDGEGMRREVLEHAFEPFFTTKKVGEGTGLGLSMVYGFARQSRGQVTLDSAPGRGTRVQLYLPRAAAEVRLPPADPSTPEMGRGETVLVVEDDAEVRAVAVNLLADLGYRVLEAADAEAALARVEAAPRVDLVLSDMVLGGALDGPQLAAALRRRWPDIRIVFMSGYPDAGVETMAPPGGDGPVIAKPFRRRELAERLRTALDAPPPGVTSPGVASNEAPCGAGGLRV